MKGLALVHTQEWQFYDDFYILSTQGVEVVLRTQWLNKLGPIIVKYSKLIMEFFVEGKLITLVGDIGGSMQQIMHQQLRRLVSTNAIATYFQLVLRP